MKIHEAVSQILEAEENLKTGKIKENLKCIGVARVGFEDQRIISGTLKEFLEIDMGGPLHSFIICSDEVHDLEKEMYDHFNISNFEEFIKKQPIQNANGEIEED